MASSEKQPRKNSAPSKGRASARSGGAGGARRQQGSRRANGARPSSTQKPKGPKVSVTSSSGIWERIKPWIPLVMLMVVAVLLVVALFQMVSCVGRAVLGGGQQTEEAAAPVLKEGEPAQLVAAQDGAPAMKLLDKGRMTASGEGRVSFAAFGDNLVGESLLGFADQWGGSGEGDGVYDFAPLYENVRDEIRSYDIAFVNQETILGGSGDGSLAWAGYPSYNTPDTMADALVDAGFRVINTNSNHTYDWWTSAIQHSQTLWNGFSSILTIGSYQDQQDRDTVRVVESNGVRVAFLSYSNGQNGYEQSDLPNDYYAVPFSEAALASDVAAARKVADVVVVYLHAGTEYTFEPDETEVAWAQACADNNVDLVIASNAHVIQPMRYLKRADGKEMLTVFGLGDFVAGYEDYPEGVLSGEFSCDFVVDEDKGVTVDNVIWHPLIEHREGTVDTVYLLRDYTTELAESNSLLSSIDDPYSWIIETTRGVMGDDFKADVRHEF